MAEFQEKNNKEKEKIGLVAVLGSFLVLFFVYLLVVGAIIYFYSPRENYLVRRTAKFIPYPAAIVGTKIITFNQLAGNLDSVKKFYENQDFFSLGLRVDFSTPEGRKKLEIKEKDILNKLVENAVIEKEAKKRGVRLTNDVINQMINRKLKEYGNEEYLNGNLQKLYGWDIEDFKKNIVEPDVYREKLFESLKKTDPSYEEAKNKIIEAENELYSEKSFENVAEKYSEGESAKNGGQLGWFNLSQMLPEVALEIINLPDKKLSGIIESSIGYHIVKIEERKKENNIDMFKISQIYIKTKPFSQWLWEMEKNHKVVILLSKFRWNKNNALVEFGDDKMNKFEEDITNDSSDSLFIF
jgi:parvulin-like peptidyl-prolyl isomerase